MTEATQAVPVRAESPGQRIIAGLLRSVTRATVMTTFRAGRPVGQQRRRLGYLARLSLPPRGVSFTPGDLGGIPGEWVEVPGQSAARLGLLYLHGGGYCVGTPATHRTITGHLAARCAARVFAVDYRLAPEHPFPAALDDAAAAARAWLQGGLDARDLVIAGDSAGGGLTLALALTLRDTGLPLPRALVLFSPFVDLTLDHLPPPPSGEVMLTRPWLEECSHAYLAGRDPLDPLVSPIAADLRGLPPTLLQAGSDELLLGDSRRLFQGLQTAGVPARLEVYPRRWHVFQLNAGMLADADRALDAVARFVREPPVVP